MRTAVDSDILFDVWADDPRYRERSLEAMERAALQGSLWAGRRRRR